MRRNDIEMTSPFEEMKSKLSFEVLILIDQGSNIFLTAHNI